MCLSGWLFRIEGHGERILMTVLILLHHLIQLQTLGDVPCHRDADKTGRDRGSPTWRPGRGRTMYARSSAVTGVQLHRTPRQEHFCALRISARRHQ